MPSPTSPPISDRWWPSELTFQITVKREHALHRADTIAKAAHLLSLLPGAYLALMDRSLWLLAAGLAIGAQLMVDSVSSWWEHRLPTRAQRAALAVWALRHGDRRQLHASALLVADFVEGTHGLRRWMSQRLSADAQQAVWVLAEDSGDSDLTVGDLIDAAEALTDCDPQR